MGAPINPTRNGHWACQLLGSGLLAAFSLVPALAQASPMSFLCDYKSFSDNKGLHAVESPFTMTFVVDPAANKAYMVGKLGTADLMIVPNASGLTLIEVTETGNVMVTAILPNGQSMHSRNTIMGDELIPSQYYGRCVVK